MEETKHSRAVCATNEVKSSDRKDKKGSKGWEKPTLEDVSGRVMAQPYIRFT